MGQSRREYWTNLVAEHQACGETVRGFCHRQAIAEHSFYWWRKKLAAGDGATFALLETAPASSGAECALELIFSGGERLRVGKKADVATLRLVVDLLRG
jgi:hypothetical protein